MVAFTVKIDETKPAMIEIATAYGKFIQGPAGDELKVCEQGTGFEAKVAERMLLGAMRVVRIRTTMIIHREGGRLDLFNDPQEK